MTSFMLNVRYFSRSPNIKPPKFTDVVYDYEMDDYYRKIYALVQKKQDINLTVEDDITCREVLISRIRRGDEILHPFYTYFDMYKTRTIEVIPDDDIYGRWKFSFPLTGFMYMNKSLIYQGDSQADLLKILLHISFITKVCRDYSSTLIDAKSLRDVEEKLALQLIGKQDTSKFLTLLFMKYCVSRGYYPETYKPFNGIETYLTYLMKDGYISKLNLTGIFQMYFRVLAKTNRIEYSPVTVRCQFPETSTLTF